MAGRTGKFMKQIYFPNFSIFPIHVPRGKELTEVQFRCPVNKTKFEIRNYLESIYGLEIEQVLRPCGTSKLEGPTI